MLTRIIIAAAALSLTPGCTHSADNASVVRESEVTNSAAASAPKVELPPGVVLPPWTSEDCVKLNGSYFFVGYGEGPNSSAAARNAMLASRQNALVCLFGGTITSTISIRENETKATYESSTELKLDYSAVNWSGYSIVSGKTFFIDNAHSRLYSQYRWSEADIAKERSRLDGLAKKIEETNAMKQEIAIKENVIKEQKTQLAELQRQENELRAIKEASNRAAAKLLNLKKARDSKQNDMMKIIHRLYCGVTIAQLIDLYREPDKTELEYYGSSITGISFSWDQFVINVRSKFIEDKLGKQYLGLRDTNEQDIAKAAKGDIIQFVYTDHAKTDRGYQICGK